MIPLQPNHWNVLGPALTECCLEVCSFYEMELRVGTADPGDPHARPELEGVVAFLGFTGDHIAGNLVLICNMALLRRAYPVPLGGEPFSAADAQDWLGELANQITGKLKARLSVAGLSFLLSIPRCVAGTGLHLTSDKFSLVLNSGHQRMLVGFDAVIAPEISLARLMPPPRTSVPGKGAPAARS